MRVSSKGHCPDNFRGPWPPTLYGKVTLHPLNLHVDQPVTSRNFSIARAARATVGFPRVRKQTTIPAQKGRTELAFSEAADTPPLPAGMSHMSDSKMSCSAISVHPSIAKPADCVGASMMPRYLP